MKLPQLSLRDLCWLVLVCALAVAWLLDNKRAASHIARLEAESSRGSLIQRLKRRQHPAGLKTSTILPRPDSIEIEMVEPTK